MCKQVFENYSRVPGISIIYYGDKDEPKNKTVIISPICSKCIVLIKNALIGFGIDI